MRLSTLAMIAVVSGIAGATTSQHVANAQSLQNEADKGIKTENSGASGYVGEQDRPGAAAHAPGELKRPNQAAGDVSAPSAQNSGTGISGAPGNKNGPAPDKSTVGSASQNLPVQEQDSSNVKGLPGNKSGPPAKR